MLESEKMFAWSAFSVFDCRHCFNLSIKCSINDRLAYACMDTVLLSTVLDVTAIKPNATECSHSKANDHLVSRYTFPEIGSQGQKMTNQPWGPRFAKFSTKKNAHSGKHASENMSVGYVGVYAIYQVQQHRALP